MPFSDFLPNLVIFFQIYWISKFLEWQHWWRYFGRILTRIGVADFQAFRLIVAKRLIQGRNNATRVEIEPRSWSPYKRHFNPIGHAADL